MPIQTETSAARFENIVVSVPLSNNYPLYSMTEIEVIYGSQLLRAIINTDYTVQLSPPNFNSFTVTPTASLIAKIDALIATPPTLEAETNWVVVRRKIPLTTSATPELVRSTTFLSDEICRIQMKMQVIAERLNRTLAVSESVIGQPSDKYLISEPSEGMAPVWRGDVLVAEIDASDIASAEGFATTVAALKEDVEDLRDETQVLRDEAEASRLAAEAAAASLNRRPPVHMATVAPLPACTYNNGASGVGATLTGNANGALTVIDGATSPTLNSRYLIQDQAPALQNGTYVLTQVGNGGAPFILTRATDGDTNTELASQFVTVSAGTTNIGGSFVCDVAASITIGTDPIVWNPYSGSSYISAIGQITDPVLRTIRSLPFNPQSADYTFQLSDIGGTVYHPAADTTPRTWTIPDNGTVAFPVGSVITVRNHPSAGALTIAITTDTLRPAGAAGTGSRTVAANGQVTLLKETATEWTITGPGLS